MIDRIRLTVVRWIGVAVAALVTWFGSAGIELASEFTGLAAGALTILAMAVLTALANTLVRSLPEWAHTFIYGED